MNSIRRGVIIGRFNPPHNGHRYLIDFAQSFVDELYIFVCTLSRDEIPGNLRFSWMVELYPGAKCIHITEENPQANRQQPNAHRIWADAMLREMNGLKVDYLFASEEYGWKLAGELGAEFVPVDPNRDQLPVSGTDIREHPLNHWNFLPEVVRPYFIKRIGILAGKESAALARNLAGRMRTLYAPSYRDYFREIQQAHQGHSTIHESRDATIHHAQLAMEAALSRQAHRFLFLSCHGGSEDLHQEILERRLDRIIIVETLLDENDRERIARQVQNTRELGKKASFFHWSMHLTENIEQDIKTAFEIV